MFVSHSLWYVSAKNWQNWMMFDKDIKRVVFFFRHSVLFGLEPISLMIQRGILRQFGHHCQVDVALHYMSLFSRCLYIGVYQLSSCR